MNVGLLTAEIGLSVWGTPANFNGLRVLASLLHRRRSTEVNQTLHDVWSSPWLVHCIYIFGGTCPNGILSGTNFILRPSIAFFYIFSVTARHSSSGCQSNFAAFSRGLHKYLAGRPSRWASAQILVILLYLLVFCTWLLRIILEVNRASLAGDKTTDLPMFAQKSVDRSYLVNNIRLLCLDYVDFYFLPETNATRRVAVCLGTHCNIGSKRPCCPVASDVEPSHVISTVHVWRRASLCRRARVDIVVINCCRLSLYKTVPSGKRFRLLYRPTVTRLGQFM